MIPAVLAALLGLLTICFLVQAVRSSAPSSSPPVTLSALPPSPVSSVKPLLVPPPSSAILLADDGYLPALLDLLDRAAGSIDITMFACVLPERAGATHPVRRILDRLAARQRAGVRIRIVLDHGVPPDRRRDGEEPPSDRAASYLAAAGVPVRWDEDRRTTHTKSMVIDGRLVVIGSTNWSASALTRNREQSVLLDDPVLAAELTRRFEVLWAGSTPVR